MKRVENWGDESWLDYVVAVVSSKLIFSNAHPSIDAFVSLLFFVSSIACPYPFWILHLLSWFLRTVDYLSDHPTHDQRADEPGFQPKANKVATLTQWNSLFFSLFYTLYLLSVILQCIDSRRSGRLKRARNGAVGGGGFFPLRFYLCMQKAIIDHVQLSWLGLERTLSSTEKFKQDRDCFMFSFNSSSSSSPFFLDTVPNKGEKRRSKTQLGIEKKTIYQHLCPSQVRIQETHDLCPARQRSLVVPVPNREFIRNSNESESAATGRERERERKESRFYMYK